MKELKELTLLVRQRYDFKQIWQKSIVSYFSAIFV